MNCHSCGNDTGHPSISEEVTIFGLRLFTLPAELMGILGFSWTGQGEATDASGIQVAGVLDSLFAYDGPLGAIATKDDVTISVWAPTAQVSIVLPYSEP